MKKAVFLVGFMGSGKSVVAQQLAAELDWRFVDLDEEIVKQAGSSIPEIFETEGEAGFRLREHECLLKVQNEHQVVVACEGAISQIEAGMNDIESFLVKMEDDPDYVNDCQELVMLEELIKDLKQRGPEENPVVALKQKLQHAIRMENYEEAARLRDSIREMETSDQKSPSHVEH